MKKLYQFSMKCKNKDNLTSTFIIDETDIDYIIGAEIRVECIFNEHINIHGTIKQEHITEIPVSSSTVQELNDNLGVIVGGINIFKYIIKRCRNCGNYVYINNIEELKDVTNIYCNYCLHKDNRLLI